MTAPVRQTLLSTNNVLPVASPAPAIQRHQLSAHSERDPSPQFAVNCLQQFKTSLLSLPEKMALLLSAPRFFIEDWQHHFGKPFSEEFPALKECDCLYLDTRRRSHLEFKTVQQLKSFFKTELTIVSVGCGECFQELIYMIKCVEAGYNVHLVLIDSNEKKVEQPLVNLEDFYRRYLKPLPCAPKITFSLYHSLESYREAVGNGASSKASLTLCIDLQDYYPEPSFPLHAYCLRFFTSHKLLLRDGLFVYTEIFDKDPHNPSVVSQSSLHQECRRLGLASLDGDMLAFDVYSYYRGAIYQNKVETFP